MLWVPFWSFLCFSWSTPTPVSENCIDIKIKTNETFSFHKQLFLSLIVHPDVFLTDDQWVPTNLDEGHLDYYFFLLAGLMALSIVRTCIFCNNIFNTFFFNFVNSEPDDFLYMHIFSFLPCTLCLPSFHFPPFIRLYFVGWPKITTTRRTKNSASSRTLNKLT